MLYRSMQKETFAVPLELDYNKVIIPNSFLLYNRDKN